MIRIQNIFGTVDLTTQDIFIDQIITLLIVKTFGRLIDNENCKKKIV